MELFFIGFSPESTMLCCRWRRGSALCASPRNTSFIAATVSDVAGRSLSLFGTGSKNIRTMVRKMREMLQENSSFLII
jgi:hypothetical protein